MIAQACQAAQHAHGFWNSTGGEIVGGCIGIVAGCVILLLVQR